jgi:hypothetical protein
VLPPSLVEVFALAIEGLDSDQPSSAVFRKRVGVLVGRFTAR